MKRSFVIVSSLVMLLWAATSWADSYSDATALFKKSSQSSVFFHKSYGYAVFPSIGKGGLIIGGAHGNGRVFVEGKHVGDTSMTQVSVGLQAGGQAYSQIIFFKDKSAFESFSTGNFEFDAGASAVVITAAAGASAGSQGATGTASGDKNSANTAGDYHKGMAVFTIVKGGAMVAATVAGQKFSYKPIK